MLYFHQIIQLTRYYFFTLYQFVIHANLYIHIGKTLQVKLKVLNSCKYQNFGIRWGRQLIRELHTTKILKADIRKSKSSCTYCVAHTHLYIYIYISKNISVIFFCFYASIESNQQPHYPPIFKTLSLSLSLSLLFYFFFFLLILN